MALLIFFGGWFLIIGIFAIAWNRFRKSFPKNDINMMDEIFKNDEK